MIKTGEQDKIHEMHETYEAYKTNKTVIGILAHVDAGKTTLCEEILYLTGNIRKRGRVDHKDAFLDTHELERARGITIFSKQAVFKLSDREITLLDTPGHADFGAEMERTLAVIDYAVLLVSASEGVNEHVRIFDRLLKSYKVPVFIFVNKMDMPDTDKERLMRELKEKISEGCTDFSDEENIAASDEELLEEYFESGSIDVPKTARLIKERRIFPCFFGSALRSEGVEKFLEALSEYTVPKDYGDEFSARVFKISRDKKGKRLTHMKITGGSLKVKEILKGEEERGAFDADRSSEVGAEKSKARIWEEKADEIRIYSGEKYSLSEEAPAGTVCAVTGLTRTRSGDILEKKTTGDAGEKDLSGGKERITKSERRIKPVLEPALSYRIELPERTDIHKAYARLCELSEEIPELDVSWERDAREISVKLMGEIQTEIIKSIVKERFGMDIAFGEGSILYKETIKNTVEGMGHFEPLRHYAEVHLIMEPLERGAGLVFESDCPTDMLALNWQRLVLTHLAEKKHRGVLTGAEITDMKITLVAGRAHEKHTEGGDFREATYRAVRQGLKKAESALLEPWYEYALTLPRENAGRAMTDIGKMSGSFSEPEGDGDMITIRGEAPVSELCGYGKEVVSYTGGRGRLTLNLKGYALCHNEEEIIERTAYDSETDLKNPTGSVFCLRGGGYFVPWNEADGHMHIESVLKKRREREAEAVNLSRDNRRREAASPRYGKKGEVSAFSKEEKELQEIFLRTYGESKRDINLFKKADTCNTANKKGGGYTKREEYLLVDGYNVIFAWDELKELAKINIDSARTKLMDILSNYQGYKKMNLIIVFDAYKVSGNHTNVEKYHNIYIVYTKEAETADQYIAKTVSNLNDRYNVTVATSDSLVQLIIFGKSAIRQSARELKEAVENANAEMREKYLEKKGGTGNRLSDIYEFGELGEEAGNDKNK